MLTFGEVSDRITHLCERLEELRGHL